MQLFSSLIESSTILIIEDSLIELMLLVNLLEKQGAKVIQALTGDSALVKIHQTLPDLILLDIQLPDLDGYQVCQRLRQQPTLENIPIVFLSGLADAASKIKAFEVGGQDYVTKPFHPQEVIMRVSQQLTNRVLKRQLIQKNQQLEQEICDREQVIYKLKQSQAAQEKSQKALSSYINYILLLQQITDAIRIQTTSQDIFKSTVLQIGKAFEVNRCVLLTYDPNLQDYLPVVATFHNRIPNQHLEDWVISLNQNDYLQTVLSQNHAVVCPPYKENIYFYELGMNRNQLNEDEGISPGSHYSQDDRDQTIQSMLSVRISYQNDSNGVIMLHQCNHPRQWTSQEMFRLTAIATHVGAALAQARLLESEKNQRLLLDTKNLQLENEIQQRKISEQSLIQQSEELEQAKKSAELANRTKSEFLANMSHELRTPLNAILGFSRVIEQTELTQKQQDYFAIINRCGNHLLRLINDVLDMSKIESGQMTLAKKRCDLYQILNTLENIFNLKGKDKAITVRFSIAPNTPQYIETDETKLRQILMNLLDNAVKFTDSGHVFLRVSPQPSNDLNLETYSLHRDEDNVIVRREVPHNNALKHTPNLDKSDSSLSENIKNNVDDSHPQERSTIHNNNPLQRIEAEEKVVWLTFEVEDTGPGISEEEIELLFQAFVQTASGKRYSGGTGLGLAISKEFVSLMDGDLTVESVIGKGSIFRFQIPTRFETSLDHSQDNSPTHSNTNLINIKNKLFPKRTKNTLLANAAIKHMSEDWRQDIKKAAITGSDSKMIALVSQIPTSLHILKATLSYWIKSFEFEKIIDLIERIET